MKNCLLHKKNKKQTQQQALQFYKISSQHLQPTGVGWKLTRGLSLVGGHTVNNGECGIAFLCITECNSQSETAIKLKVVGFVQWKLGSQVLVIEFRKGGSCCFYCVLQTQTSKRELGASLLGLCKIFLRYSLTCGNQQTVWHHHAAHIGSLGL